MQFGPRSPLRHGATKKPSAHLLRDIQAVQVPRRLQQRVPRGRIGHVPRALGLVQHLRGSGTRLCFTVRKIHMEEGQHQGWLPSCFSRCAGVYLALRRHLEGAAQRTGVAVRLDQRVERPHVGRLARLCAAQRNVEQQSCSHCARLSVDLSDHAMMSRATRAAAHVSR